MIVNSLFKNGIKRILLSLFILLFLLFSSSTAYAISSNNYTIEEDFVGGGGLVESESASFKAQDTIGAPVVGDSGSTNFRQQAGATTTNDPNLTFSVNSSSVNLGGLSTSITKTGTVTFDVLNYTGYGYSVYTIGNPPDNGTHTLASPASPTVSAVNTEQFGINLVDNATPDVGADLSHDPDGTFSFGSVDGDYDNVDNFMYISGDVIASAPKSSGKTSYTISYIANISNNTPGGSYSGIQTLLVVGTY